MQLHGGDITRQRARKGRGRPSRSRFRSGSAHLPADRIATATPRRDGAVAPCRALRAGGPALDAGERRRRRSPRSGGRGHVRAPGAAERARPDCRRQRRHARLPDAPPGRSTGRSRPPATASRRWSWRSARTRSDPERRDDAEAGRLRAAARAAPAARAPRRRSSCCRRAPVRRRASRGWRPAPTTTWSSRSRQRAAGPRADLARDGAGAAGRRRGTQAAAHAAGAASGHRELPARARSDRRVRAPDDDQDARRPRAGRQAAAGGGARVRDQDYPRLAAPGAGDRRAASRGGTGWCGSRTAKAACATPTGASPTCRCATPRGAWKGS